MNLRRPLHSSSKVWLTISVPLFIACWFIRGGKGGDEPIGKLWCALFAGEYGSLTELLMVLAIYTLAFAVPAAAVGWVLQFPFCAAFDYFRGGVTDHDRP
jgi:hypothetical protein